MLARAVARHCQSVGDEVVALNRDGLDITDRSGISLVLYSVKPDAVINCAAFTDVDGAESSEDKCYAVNAFAVESLAAQCAESEAAFVTISTDYVFDGKQDGFYTENDDPNPLGVYGRSKLDGERRAAEANPDSVIVRSGWIYGRSGTNFLSVMHRLLAEGKNIKAISDSFGTPTFADDLSMRLRELAASGERGIFHVANTGEGTSYLGFAEAVCDVAGFDPSLIQPSKAGDLKRPAPRPRNSRLASVRDSECGFEPLPDWRSALRRFLRSEMQLQK